MNEQLGDIVQITDDKHHWFPCLIIVTEVKTWGIQGCTIIPGEDGGQAYIRLKHSEYEVVGRAAFVPERHEENYESNTK